MRRLFLSDVHLAPRDPQRTRAFLSFLEAEAPRTDELYILGDLFDYWIGPKHLSGADYGEALRALRAATEAGLQATFLLGNRDFYMKGFTEATGVALAPRRTEHEIAAGAKRVYLCHGEYLEDRRGFWIGVQEFIRSRGMERVYTRLPACAAKGGARFYRWVSERRFLPGKPKPRRAVILSEALLEERFRSGADVIVCGHVHRAQRRDFFIDGRARTLFTLGDWADRPNCLVEEDGEWRLSEVVGA